MSDLHATFLGLDPADCAWESSKAVILPLPFERTTSYGGGTAAGPEAILKASAFVELYDEELDAEPADHGIHTLPLWLPESFEMGAAIAEMEAVVREQLEAEKFVVVLGGEHSLTLGPVRAARAVHGDIGVVQFDAHSDLRDGYEGTPYSHASVLYRIHELGIPHAAVGIRSLCQEEADLIRSENLPIFWGHELDAPDLPDRFLAAVDALPEKVYLTFDLDFFDPSLLPATGTPEPGGGFWQPTVRLLREIFRRKTVVAMDIVELAPIPGMHASDFVAAKLAYKCLGFYFSSKL